MDQIHHHVLSRLPPVETPPSLFERVMRAIERVRARRLYARCAFASSALTLSIGYVAVSWSAMLAELSESSFIEFMRLVYSDPDIVLGNVKDLALGVVETLPYVSIVLTLVIAFSLVGIVALADSLRHLRRTRMIHHLTLN